MSVSEPTIGSAARRRPSITRRCPKVWTPAEERAMQRAAARLGADIRAAGGIDEWIQTRLDAWLTRSACPTTLRRRR